MLDEDEIREEIVFGEYHAHTIKQRLFSGRTKFHYAEIVEFQVSGLSLLLDGRIQSCQIDEFVYNEAAVHPALIIHPKPERVLCLAGGTGGIVREVLRHEGLKEITVMDEDPEVGNLVRKYLAHMNPLPDSRLVTNYGDCLTYLKCCAQFDVIIFDSPDPFPGSPYASLFAEDSLRSMYNVLAPDGILAIQLAPVHSATRQIFKERVNALSTVFPFVRPYHVEVHSLGTSWGFALASANEYNINILKFNNILKQRLTTPTRFFDEVAFKRMWLWPKHLY